MCVCVYVCLCVRVHVCVRVCAGLAESGMGEECKRTDKPK